MFRRRRGLLYLRLEIAGHLARANLPKLKTRMLREAQACPIPTSVSRFPLARASRLFYVISTLRPKVPHITAYIADSA